MIYFFHVLLQLSMALALASPVVISEVLWVGSPNSTADEWVELQLHPSFTGAYLPLEGIELWTKDSNKRNKRLYAFTHSDRILAGTPYLISNFSEESSTLAVTPQSVTTDISLLNTGLQLWLQTASGEILDTVDDGVGAPFAGGKVLDGTVYASMERFDLLLPGNLPSNWFTATVSIGFDDGARMLGTPGVPYTALVSDSSSSASSESLESSLNSSEDSVASSVESSESSIASSIDSSVVSSSESVSSEILSTSSTEELSNESVSSVSSATLEPIIRITEILPNPIGNDATEWIELLNTTQEPIDVSTIQLRDTSGASRALQLSGTTLLLPNSYTVVTKDLVPFTLKNTSGSVALLQNNSIIDEVYYTEAPEGVSFGRIAFTDAVSPYCTPTPGFASVSDEYTLNFDWQNFTGNWTESGAITAHAAFTFNLQLTNTGSTPLTDCTVSTTDGWVSTSCNPPSHTVSVFGSGQLLVHAKNYCGTTVEHTFDYFIENKSNIVSNNAQNTTVQSMQNCPISTTSGIHISEIFPDPTGDEVLEEWIEIHNENSVAVSLCGWSLDDASDAGKVYSLYSIAIPPHSYVKIPRLDSKIALNNSNESVRLFAPFNSEPFEVVSYLKAIPGESYALRDDGYFLWTPFITPGERNLFRTVERRFASDTVVVSAALPNPDGKDLPSTEWVEVTNVSNEPQNISGYSVDNRLGSSAPFFIESLWLEPGETKRFTSLETGLELSNTYDEARLLDPDGYVLSAFDWQNAENNYIYRLPRIRTEKVWAKVMRCIDGDTLSIAFDTPDELRLLPKEVERSWLMATEDVKPEVTLRLLGIDTPETVHPFVSLEPFGKQAAQYTCEKLQSVKRIQVQFDEVTFDKYNRLLAYVYVGGELLQAQLLRNGLATAYTRFPFALKSVFTSYESEARIAFMGLWQAPEVVQYVQSQKDQFELEKQIENEGITVTFSPKTGFVESGTLVSIVPSVVSTVYVAIGSGTFLPYFEPLIITKNTALSAYAVYTNTGSTPFTATSATITAHFTVPKAEYLRTIEITEVFPSPKKGEEEWIELRNTSDVPFDITDYILDDVSDGGSQPYVFPWGTIINPGEVFLVFKSVSGLTLNNTNDEVWLKDPLGNNIQHIAYGKVRTGTSIQPIFNTYCTSDVPSPGMLQSCITLSTKKTMVDEDFDGLADDYEQYIHRTNPTLLDTDADGYYDGFEIWAKTDPTVFTPDTRELRLLYKKFIQKNLKISFKEYKTVAPKLTVKNMLPFTISVQVAAKEYSILAGQKIALKPVLPHVGEYVIEIKLPSGLHTVSDRISLQLNTLFVQKQKKYSYKQPNWAKFTERFVALQTILRTDTTEFDALAKQRATSLSEDDNGVSYFSIMCSVAVITLSILISTWYWRRYKNMV